MLLLVQAAVGFCAREAGACDDVDVRVWAFEPGSDNIPETAKPGDLEGRRAVLVASESEEALPRAWMAVDDYDAGEATVLFGAPAGDGFHDYLDALPRIAVREATELGFTVLLAHWRGGWGAAEQVLRDHGFLETSPGIWRRQLSG